jgi:hypothetical protein
MTLENALNMNWGISVEPEVLKFGMREFDRNESKQGQGNLC